MPFEIQWSHHEQMKKILPPGDTKQEIAGDKVNMINSYHGSQNPFFFSL